MYVSHNMPKSINRDFISKKDYILKKHFITKSEAPIPHLGHLPRVSIAPVFLGWQNELPGPISGSEESFAIEL